MTHLGKLKSAYNVCTANEHYTSLIRSTQQTNFHYTPLKSTRPLVVICFCHKQVVFLVVMVTSTNEKNAIIQKYTLYSTVPNKRGGPNSRGVGKILKI